MKLPFFRALVFDVKKNIIIFAKNLSRGYIMDGLIDFLIFVGFIGFCIFFDKLNDIMKKTQKQSSPKPVVVATPPQQKPYQPPHQKNSVKKAKKVNDRISSFKHPSDRNQRMEFKNEGIRSTENIMQPIETLQHSEFEMNTAEDIRKAIVWSEILKRKY